MLSERSAATVRATLPAIAESIDAITPLFYRRMFGARPELLRDLFNRGNQATGDQPRALAASIAAYAGYLVGDAPRPAELLDRIAHKHASLGIVPEQYPVVHEHLFAAIGEVLGDALTPEAAAAWDEVYWAMAGALIGEEAGLYRAAGVRAGDVWRRLRVAARREETADVAVLDLVSADRSPLPAARAGQYVAVQVALPDGARQIRQYSLVSAPGAGQWTVAVKHERGGPAAPDGEVSTRIHTTVRTGDTLDVSLPFGGLTLQPGDGPLLLASAGIGCTPMTAMLRGLVAEGSQRQVTVVHADRSPGAHAFAAEQAGLVAALPAAQQVLFYEEPGSSGARQGLADFSGLDLPAGLTAYLCGPRPFMSAARGALLRAGVPAAAVRHETFGPDVLDAAPAPALQAGGV